MVKSLVFFDLDGTLLNDKAMITKEVEATLVKLKDNGHLPVIATGRSFPLMTHILNKTVIDSYILVNGQKIIIENEVVYDDSFKLDSLDRLTKLAERLNADVAYYGYDEYVVTDINSTVEKGLDYFNIPIPTINKNFYKDKDVYMMALLTENMAHDEIFIDALPELKFYRTSPYSMDVVSAHNSKANAIKRLKDYMNYPDIPTYAFGDGMNDYEMLQEVDYSIAMGNAVDELKKLADIVVASNNDLGIIEGLKYYSLI